MMQSNLTPLTILRNGTTISLKFDDGPMAQNLGVKGGVVKDECLRTKHQKIIPFGTDVNN